MLLPLSSVSSLCSQKLLHSSCLLLRTEPVASFIIQAWFVHGTLGQEGPVGFDVFCHVLFYLRKNLFKKMEAGFFHLCFAVGEDLLECCWMNSFPPALFLS